MNHKVTIVTLTYNHENVIAQTLDSLLAQKTNFDFEILIGDDSSTDNTLQIIEAYKKKYPQKIRILKSDKNIGLEQNYLRCYRVCTTEFVAICDGDDYWIDPLKLQKQVDFLSTHPAYGLVGTMINFFDEETGIFTPGKRIAQDYISYTIDDIILSNPLTSSSVLFRNKLLQELLVLYDSQPEALHNFIDYSLWMYFASQQKVAELKEVATVYRLSKASVSQNKNYVKQWAYRKRNYKHYKFFRNYLINLSPETLQKADYNRALWYYKIAAVNGDTQISGELYRILRQNKDFIRAFFIRMILRFPKTIRLADYYDIIRAKLSSIFSETPDL